MNVADPAVAQSSLELRADLESATDLGSSLALGRLDVRAMRGRLNVWFVVALDGKDVAALRCGIHAELVGNVGVQKHPDGTLVVDFSTALGSTRARLEVRGRATVHCTTSLIPKEASLLRPTPRDLLMLVGDGATYTKQRGLRSGIVFAGTDTSAELGFGILYFQNFSALSDLLGALEASPADTVGGTWPELGLSLPVRPESTIPEARETVLSDVFVTFGKAVANEIEIARCYLDLLAETYLELERPSVAYHPWNERAAAALRDLSMSPACTYERQHRRYVMPYVGDGTKPPESMVQFTVAVNASEYDRWRNRNGKLATTLRETAPSFFDEDIGCIVRWLPGESFDPEQAEDKMNHRAMDSWYLHHALFNVFRFADEGDAVARELFAKSLPYLVRVARRFSYRWPIFFDLQTLDIIRAEASPGKGGERDVAGMYALVMIHAYEMFGDEGHLREAEAAVTELFGFGFELAYQLNTTGFAAEAALRLWKITSDERYLGLAEVCIANVFDNVWLWQCDYGFAAGYDTFFGLFPLRDAPYIAPYEELEAHAKFHEFLRLGGDAVRPSLRLLIAEFQKYGLHRCWFFYPDTLAPESLADEPRNGSIQRTLSVPLEDLQDGLERSGQVGQEIYGAGLPFVFTARHYMTMAGGEVVAYCNYPIFDYSEEPAGRATWRIGGDRRCDAEIRLFVDDPDCAARTISCWSCGDEGRVRIRGTTSAEGHAVFAIGGGGLIEIGCDEAQPEMPDGAVTIGPLAARAT